MQIKVRIHRIRRIRRIRILKIFYFKASFSYAIKINFEIRTPLCMKYNRSFYYYHFILR